jgi:hypothetical protein
MGATRRGSRNPFRNLVRAAVAICLLGLVVGVLAVMIHAALLRRQQVPALWRGGAIS